jgi:acetolactate synthase-1/2/3 large subunit
VLAGVAAAFALQAAGVAWVSGVPGESFLPLLEGLRLSRLPFIATSHESGAVFMASAYSRATGRPSVVSVTRGPGAANALIGIHEAFQANAPVVLIVGQVDSAVRHRGAMQEMEISDVFRSVAKAVVEVTSPERLAPSLLAALRKSALDTPGPIVVSVPKDVFYGEVPATKYDTAMRLGVAGGRLSSEVFEHDVDRLLDMIRGAKRGLIVAAAGFAQDDAAVGLSRLARASGFGVIGAHGHPDILPIDDPSWLGCSTIRSPGHVRDTLVDADVIFFFGGSLDDRTTQGYRTMPASTAVVMDCPAVGWDEYLDARLIRADPVRMAERLAARLEMEPGHPGRQQRIEWTIHRRNVGRDMRLDVLAAAADEGLATNFPAILDAIDRTLPADCWVVGDAGSCTDWIVHYLPFPSGRRYCGTASGSMGFGVPAAIGLQLARPKSRALVITGDGGFLMSCAEIATLAQLDLPITVVVCANQVQGSIAIHQDRVFPGRRHGVFLPKVSHAGMAEAMGVASTQATSVTELASALATSSRSSSPFLIEVQTDPEALSPIYYEESGAFEPK